MSAWVWVLRRIAALLLVLSLSLEITLLPDGGHAAAPGRLSGQPPRTSVGVAQEFKGAPSPRTAGVLSIPALNLRNAPTFSSSSEGIHRRSALSAQPAALLYTETPLSGRVPISITETGFDPRVVTITIGTTVEWTNRTQQTVHLQSGEPFRIYLPLVLRNVGGTSGQATPGTETTARPASRLNVASGAFSGVIPPGGTFTHTFTTEGDYPYFLTEHPAWTGLVKVEPLPFDFAIGIQPPTQAVTRGRSVTYTVQVTGTLGEPQPVTLTAGHLPAGVLVSLEPATVIPTGTAVLSLTAALDTPIGEHTFVVTGTAGARVHTATAVLVVNPHPDFSLDITPSVREVIPGQRATYMVQVTALHGFSSPVSLSVSGLPPGALAAWSRDVLTPTDTAVLTVTTAPTTPAGSHPLTLTGRGGDLVHTAVVTLSVQPPPDFTLGVVPAAGIVTQGQAISFTVYVTGERGFAEPVNLSLEGLPADVTAAWSANPVTPTAQTVLTLTTSLSTPAGDYPMLIRGAGGGLTRTAEMTLSVVVLAPDLAIEGIQTAPATPLAGRDTLITVTVRNGGGAALNDFRIDLYVNPPGLPGVGDSGVVSWTVAGLGPGLSVPLTTTYVFTSAGSYHLWAQADTLNRVLESNEANNVAGPVTVTVLSPVQQVCGTIAVNTVWYSGVVYVVTCDVTVNSGVTLTVQPGAEVRFNQNTGLNVNGTLLAAGTASQPITFTANADTPTPGYWKGLRFGSGSVNSQLDHVVVTYGGYGGNGNIRSFGATLRLTNNRIGYSSNYGLYATDISQIFITNTAFLSNTGYAAYIALGWSGVAFSPVLSGNQALGNGVNGLGLNGKMLTSTLPGEAGLPYVVDGLTVAATATLTVEAGAVLKFPQFGSLYVDGTLRALGTPDRPVVFTSLRDDAYGGDTNNDGAASAPAPGDWECIYVNGPTAQATLHHTLLRYSGYSGSSCASSGLYGGLVNNGGTVSISHSTIAFNQNAGIYALRPLSFTLSGTAFLSNTGYAAYIDLGWSEVAFSPVLSGNQALGNGVNGLGLNGKMLTSTLPGEAGLPYVVDGLTVAATATLTVEAGAVLKFPQFGSLYVDGTLRALGTPDRPVVFTSLRDDAYGGDTNNDGAASAPAPGDWECIYVNGPTAQATLHHTLLRYSGYSGSSCASSGLYGGLVNNGGTVSISHSTIAFNQNAGIAHYNGLTTIQNSNIYGNSGYGVYNADTTYVLNAENNWWGSDSGPAPYGSGDGINYRTCWDSDNRVYYICQFYVDADPWLGKSVYQGGQMGQAGPGSRNQAFEAEPVNTANGNYFYQHTDLSIPTRGLPLDFTRAYNSLNPQPGPLGYGWTHNWSIRLTEPTTGTVVVTFGDGHVEKWTWTGSGYAGAPGVFGILVRNGDGTWDLTQKDQTRYRFAADGRLLWIEDKNGNRTTLTYDAQGRLIAVTEPAGRALTFEYASPISPTLISRVTDHISRAIQFAYNITGELTVVTDVLGYATTMTYDANHRLLTITDANGHTFVRNVYDDRGRVREQYDALNNRTTFAYDEPAHRTLVTDPRGNTTIHQYDAEWRLISETDPLGNTASYDYDAYNNRIRIVDRRGYTTTMAYDDRGNVLVITDTLGYTRTYAYDSRNNLIRETDPLGRVTTYEYDDRGNLIRRVDALGNVTVWAYNAYGQVISVTDARGNITQYAYDAWGRQTVITDALGNVTRFTYDDAGRKLSEIDPMGRITRYAYDAAGRVTVITDALGYTTVYTYDAVGNRIAVQDALGRITQYGYDAKDRLVVITNALGLAVTFSYDANDNLTRVTDPLGRSVTYTYDVLNRLASTTDPLGNTTTYQYDANGNRIQVTDANGRITRYTYDALNRLVSVTDAGGGTVTYGYDAAGNRTRVTDANGHTTVYIYDALNRLVGIRDPLGNATLYAYDAVGNRIGKTLPDGTVITYTYDAMNRLVGVSAPGLSVAYAYDQAGNRTAITDATGVTLLAYDPLNRLVRTTYPDGRTVGYIYDAAGRRVGLIYPNGYVVTYTYDLLDRLVSVTDWSGRVVTYTYDAAGQLLGYAYPNGTSAAYSYDPAGRLTAITHTSSVSGTFAFFRYTYDGVGNRLSEVSAAGTTAYTYDALYRLIGVSYPDGERVTYAYDPMGNRTAMTSTVSGSTTYAYDAADRLLTAGTDTFGWDANGRLIMRTYGATTVTYTFDPLDRLIRVISGTTTVTFTYNGDGVRVGKTVNGIATTYVQDLAAPLPVVLVETTNGEDTLYIYGPDLIARVQPNGDRRYYHGDALGSVRALSDDAGRVVATYAYDAFGALRLQTDGGGNPFTFTGEQLDGEIGLVYLRTRYYDPTVGRFITRDGFPGHDLLTQSRNKYVYVQNNPVLHDDPDGQFWNFVAGFGAGVLEYTVKTAIYNAIEGKPLTSILEGWDLGEAAISGAKGAVVYGLGLGPMGSAIVTGIADATTSVYRQYKEERKVSLKRAAAEGIVGGFLSYLTPEFYPFKSVRGRYPSGKYWTTGLFGKHALQEYARAIFRGLIEAPLHEEIKRFFFPPSVEASEYNSAVYGSYEWSELINLQPVEVPLITRPPSRGK